MGDGGFLLVVTWFRSRCVGGIPRVNNVFVFLGGGGGGWGGFGGKITFSKELLCGAGYHRQDDRGGAWETVTGQWNGKL